jgi:hypothetical protein
MYRDESLAARQDRIEREKAQIDAESDAIARDGARLADELRTLDNGNPPRGRGLQRTPGRAQPARERP